METAAANIRTAELKDLESITAIYNDAVLKTTTTFDTQPKSLEEQKAWFQKHGGKLPVLVAERDGVIFGWASLSSWSDRCAYAETAEISAYMAEGSRGKGLGRALVDKIIEMGRKEGLHTILARNVEGNIGSARLLESSGFKKIGTMKEVGRKFGQLLDVHFYQLIFPAQ